MSKRSFHHRCAAWLALLATLWGALVPTLAQGAVSASQQQGWVEVCSSSGVLWVRVEGNAESHGSPGGPMSPGATHCPLCPLLGAAGLPATPSLLPGAGAAQAAPTARFASAWRVALWPAAQSRAPPTA